MKKINYFIFLFAIIAICSCSKKNDLPKGVINIDKMAMYLVDIYEAEAKVTAMRVKKDSAAILFRHYELQIQEKYGLNDSTYRHSYKYYLDNPHLLEKAYDIVIDSLGVRERLLKN